jgi:excisionase family DNA binding protein
MALAYTIREACEASGIGRSSIYELLKSGALRARKHGKRTIILESDLRRWLKRLPELSLPRARRRRPPNQIP